MKPSNGGPERFGILAAAFGPFRGVILAAPRTEPRAMETPRFATEPLVAPSPSPITPYHGSSNPSATEEFR